MDIEQRYFTSLCNFIISLGKPPNETHKSHIKEQFSILTEHYSEQHRHYHTLAHVISCLLELDDFCSLNNMSLHDRTILEICIFYHDIIYNISAPDNEELSAQLCCEVLEHIISPIPLPTTLHRTVYDLIVLTKSHTFSPNEHAHISYLAPILLDIDLSILGGASDVFDHYDVLITHEYVPDFKHCSAERLKPYYQGRLQVLRHFHDLPKLYKSTHFSNKYEATAKSNLQRAITMYSKLNL